MPMDPPRRSVPGRDFMRRNVLRALAVTGAGEGAARVATWLPRGAAKDAPAALFLRPPARRNVAILAHYSSDGQLDGGFAHLGRSLRDLDYEVVVATTAPAPLHGLAEQCSDFAFGVVTRGNEGFDFQSWRRGIEELRVRGVEINRLILTNGSMHGPLADIDHILTYMDRHPTWGMTESMDLRRHIQSWWLAFGRPVLDHPQFDQYWARVRPATNKWGTILTHELKWADDLSLAGPAAAFVRVEDHQCRRNPLFFAWKELIRDWQMPFLKRSLLLANYDRIDMTGWQDFLRETTPDFDLALASPAKAS